MTNRIRQFLSDQAPNNSKTKPTLTRTPTGGTFARLSDGSFFIANSRQNGRAKILFAGKDKRAGLKSFIITAETVEALILSLQLLS